MRISEVLGLTWDAIDLDKKIITLDKQIIYLRGQGHFFTTPKTKSSNRTIFISDFLISELQSWQNRQAENEKSIGVSYVYIYKAADNKIIQQSKVLPAESNRIELVCTKETGHFVLKSAVEKHLHNEGLNAHSFRHTHATMLIEHGATPKGVAGRLGHSNAAITQNLYTHNTEKIQQDTADIFEKITQTND